MKLPNHLAPDGHWQRNNPPYHLLGPSGVDPKRTPDLGRFWPKLDGLLFASVMLGAIFIFHTQHGWARMELEFSLLMISLYFVMRGNDDRFPAPAPDVHAREVDTQSS